MVEVIQSLIIPLLALLYISLLIIFTSSYFSYFLKHKRSRKIFYTVLTVYFIIITVMNFQIHPVVYNIIVCTILFIIIDIFYSGDKVFKLLLFVYYQLFIFIGGLIITKLVEYITFESFMANRLSIMLIMFTIYAVIVFICYKIMKNMEENIYSLNKKEYLLLFSIPTISFISLYNEEFILTLIALLLINFIAFINFFVILKKRREEQLNIVLARENIYYKDYLTSVENNMFNNHDFKNIMQNIYCHIEKQEYSVALTEISSVIDDSSKSNINYSNVIAIDAILNFKSKAIIENNIDFSVEVVIPQDVELVNNIVVSSILGNLLDNATTSAKNTKEKKIEVKIKYINNKLVIFVLNSSLSSSKNYNANFISSSKNSRTFGLGLRSIKHNVYSLGGYCDFRHNDNMFESIVELPVKEK